MYQWLLFLHVGAVLLFLLAHGIHVTVMWKWRLEPDPERGLTLFHGIPDAPVTRFLAVAVVVTGLLLGFAGGWWRQWWMWLALAMFIGIWGAMLRWGGGFFDLVQEAAERAIEERSGGSGSTAAMEAYHATRRGWHPPGMMAVGIGGLAVILWLMMFKPF
jgi:hypothetical protein